LFKNHAWLVFDPYSIVAFKKTFFGLSPILLAFYGGSRDPQ